MPAARMGTPIPALAALALLCSAFSLSAATFTVDSTSDAVDTSPGDGFCNDGSGNCTLRAAIQEANSLAGADEISLPAGTYTLAIAGHSEDGAVSGDLDIGSEIVLTGAGSATTIIDGGALDRVFDFRSHVAAFSAEITGVTIQNGSAPGGADHGWGGGFAVRPVSSSRMVTLTLTDVVITANTALANGCGVYVAGYTDVTIVDSVIQNHTCPGVSGGAIENRGTLTIRGSTLQGNQGENGGAIRAFGGAVTTIEDSLLTDNSGLRGGAYYSGSSSNTLWVRDSTFSLNDATGDLGIGGGAAYLSGFSQIERTSIVDNEAPTDPGGGLAGGSGTVNIYDSTISGNTGELGGAMFCFGVDALELRNVTISGNSAPNWSGGVYLWGNTGPYTINNSTIHGNELTVAGPGSNLYVSQAQVSIGNSIVGGGIGGVNCTFASGGSLVSAGYNLDDGTSCGLSGTGDQSSATLNLDALADNGGPTHTHALLAGSNAIDMGDPAVPGSCETADQRGAPRPADGDGDTISRCDAGAYEIVPSADLSITKDDGATDAVPGTSTIYEIAVDNAGPDDVTGTTVTDVLDDTVFDAASATWTCTLGGAGMGTDCPASGTGAELAAGVSVDIDAGDGVTIEVIAPVRPEATGSVVNTADVGGGAFEGDLDNNSATDANTLTPEADLSITKDDGVAAAVPGEQVVYTITAANAGPSDTPDATVADNFPAELTCSWTCAGGSGGSCAPGPVNGDISESVDLPAGGSVVFTVTCAIDPTATGSLSNTATVTAPSGVTDDTPANNSASDTNTVLTPETDLSITKSNGATEVLIGGQTTYTIVGSNSGPSVVPGATVADTFPAALSCSWTCVGAGGGTCSPGPSATDIADSVNLPVGATVTYTAVCSVDGMAEGQLVNSASISPPAGVTERTPANNSASDSDLLIGECGFPNNVTLANRAIDTAESHTACLTITIGPNVTITGAGSLTAMAGSLITFLDAFGMDPGCPMTAEIDEGLLPP